jgi:hypothetical protein
MTRMIACNEKESFTRNESKYGRIGKKHRYMYKAGKVTLEPNFATYGFNPLAGQGPGFHQRRANHHQADEGDEVAMEG